MAAAKTSKKRTANTSLESRIGGSSHRRPNSSHGYTSSYSVRRGSHTHSRKRKPERRSESGSIDSVAEHLMGEGMSTVDAYTAAHTYTASRAERKHNWSPGTWINRVLSYKGKSLWGAIKGAYYLAQALSDTQRNVDPLKQIIAKRNANVLVLPGYLSIPGYDTIMAFQKELGREVIYANSTNPTDIHRYVSEMYARNGDVTIIGFSDGGPVAADYLNTHNDNKVGKVFAVASNPLHTSSRKVVNIVGTRDMLAPLESEYTGVGIPVDSGHAEFFYNPRVRKELAQIIKKNQPIGAYSTPGTLVTSRHFNDSMDHLFSNN